MICIEVFNCALAAIIVGLIGALVWFIVGIVRFKKSEKNRTIKYEIKEE